jgi:adenine deaminase
MLVPSEFARAAVVHGTVATVSDPHEIGNVLGVEGVRYMLDNAEGVPLKFNFGAPSCVPATSFETAGAEITADEVAELLDDPRIRYLSEMMNFPGVLHGDGQVAAKLDAAKKRGKPIDGHAPGLRGEQAEAYIAAGISTDHECFTKEEADDKLRFGAKILIREGSAARNFDALYPLLDERPDRVMLCSDDKHPDELLAGHINLLVRRAVARGVAPMHALRAACVNPVEHYGLDVGLLRVGDPADFIEVDNLENFNVLRTWIDGRLVAENGRTTIPQSRPAVVNRFSARPVKPEQFAVAAESDQVNVIEAIDGQLITRRHVMPAKIVGGQAVADPSRDLLKLVVVNRYADAPPAVAFIQGFGLRSGALASSVAHDSHNIVAVGASDEELRRAVNLVIEARGGLSVVSEAGDEVLPLPVAGLMATGSCEEVGRAYEKLDRLAKQLGSPLRAPFMTLSFMALLVIPDIKLSDKGLFDGGRFEFLPLFAGS